MQRSAFCRSRRELSNAYLLTKFGFDSPVYQPASQPRTSPSKLDSQIEVRANIGGGHALRGDAEVHLRNSAARGGVSLHGLVQRKPEQPVLDRQKRVPCCQFRLDPAIDHRRRFLQVNTRWKALAEIYTMHSFAPFWNLNFFVKNRQKCCD